MAKNTGSSVAVTEPAPRETVEKNVNFSLKKEDLMTLIIEGRKEVMEETIAKCQNERTKLTDQFEKLKDNFLDAIRKKLESAFTEQAEALAKVLFNDDKKHVLFVALSDFQNEQVDYYVDTVQTIKNEWGEKLSAGASIKGEKKVFKQIEIPSRATFNISVSFGNKTFVKAHDFFKNDPLPAVVHGNSSDFKLANQSLDIDKIKQMDEYKVILAKVEELKAAEMALGTITSEYALFSMNKDRAKASMIKEVLASDEKGKSLLDNLTTAARGTKLLS